MAASGDPKCPCNACGVHLQFPEELAGTLIPCPTCGAETLLDLPVVEPEEPAEPDLPEPAVSLATLLGAFQGTVRGQRASFFYQIGLLLVAGAILILPAIYFGLVALGVYGLYAWATHYVWLLKPPHYGVYIAIAKFFLYITPLFVGGIVVFFMIKPLLAKRPQGAQPLALNPGAEPLLFAFVTEICRSVGAPVPSRIDVDCNLNAAASFRRGFKSFFGNDLVLTLGLPLVAGMNLTQLAGIIAHEFGHFTQTFAMRLTYVIYRVNRWFARVIYERDQWDLALEDWAEEEEDGRVQIIIIVAHIGIEFSRFFLKGLMWIGVAISSFVSRQMEYNADAYEIEFVGSEVFEQSTIRFATLGASLERAYKNVRVYWNNSRALPENFPHFLSVTDSRIPDEKRVAIADRVGLERTPWHSTHPASGDRIRCARQAQKPGLFALDIPATELFSNFKVLARQVTMLHYSDDLDLPLPLIDLRPTESFFESARSAEPEPEPAREKMEKAFGPARLKLKATAK